MTVQLSERQKLIELLRANGFNCFPVPKGQKGADYRYQAERTIPNQEIKDSENFGVIPIQGMGTAIVDFDDKEKYRERLEDVAKKYMVTESPHGFHLLVKGLTGMIQKTELYDFTIQEKKIVEIQGPKHYCIGATSILTQDNKQLEYKSIGTDKIIDEGGKNFSDYINTICKKFNLEGEQKTRDQHYQMRQRFKEGKLPTKGTSNDYFFNASLQCNSDGLTRDEAYVKIGAIFEKWRLSDSYSDRPWNNIEAKIDDVYDNDRKLETGRKKGSTDSGVDRTEIAREILETRKLFSDVETDEIYEDVNGFLEKINNNLKRELWTRYPIMETIDYTSIKAKLVGQAKEIPSTDKDLIVFKDGKFSWKAKTLIESDNLAEMGFKDYNYLEKTKENEPTEWLKIIFDNIPESEHPRIKGGLKAILYPYLDSRISVIHGNPGTGKSTGLLILHRILGDYSEVFELEQLLTDKFIKAKIKGKQLIILQDLPQTFKDFSIIKTLTGEQWKQERGFMQDSTTFENKIKIWASCNNLAKIPENEKAPMYSRRLSLIHNIRKDPYPQDPKLIERIAKDEGEKIISWILNLTDEECQYEEGKTVRKEWEKLASPEVDFITSHYDISDSDSDVSVMKVKRLYEEETGFTISLDSMKKALTEEGYIIKLNVIKNIKTLIQSGDDKFEKL